MPQGSIPEAVYRQSFLLSPWPSLLLDRALSVVVAVNQAAQTYFSLTQSPPFPLSSLFSLESCFSLPSQTVTLSLSRAQHEPEEWHFQILEGPFCLLQGPLTSSQRYRDLQQASQRKSELIANISHELRTPMTSILGWPEIILDMDGLPLLVTQAARAIRKDGLYLRQLLEDLIDLSKIEAGHLQLDLQCEDLVPIVLSAVDTLAEAIQQKQLNLSIDLPSLPVYAVVDPLRMTQIVLNYLSNAIKYTSPQGSIWIRLSQGEEVILCIEDNGMGMDEQVRQRIFERFMRAEEALANDGVGIGLDLVKKLADLHHGRTWVESQLNKGSCFYLALPVCDPRGGSVPSPSVQSVRRLALTHLLLIDETEEESSLLQQLLQPYFHRITVQSFVPDFQVLAGILPDIVVLSTSLTSDPHHLWLRALRQNAFFSKLPVLALSASAMKGDAERLMDLGYSGFVAKPFLKEDLLQYIQLMLTGKTPYV